MDKVTLFLKKRYRLVISLVALFFFLLLALNILMRNEIGIDKFYSNYLSKIISEGVTIFFKLITKLGNAATLIFITLASIVFIKNKKIGLFTVINLVSIFAFNILLKFIFARPRPIGINLIIEKGYSFPSGHATVSTAFYGLFIYLIWKSKFTKFYKWLFTILLSVLIVLICLSRIYLGVHYTSDVLAGVLFSLVYLDVFILIISKYNIK